MYIALSLYVKVYLIALQAFSADAGYVKWKLGAGDAL